MKNRYKTEAILMLAIPVALILLGLLAAYFKTRL